MQKIKDGDIVRLKSGGPKMTVTGVYGGTYDSADVHVAWMNEKGDEREAIFAPRFLEICSDTVETWSNNDDK